MKVLMRSLSCFLAVLLCVVCVGCNPPASQSGISVSNSEGSSESGEEIEPKEYDQEVITMLGPKGDSDPQIEIKVEEQSETDPRLVYTKTVLALIKQVVEDIEGVVCTPALKEQMLANPKAIPELHEEHNYFVYSISQLEGSTSVSCSVGYYDNGNMVVELIKFNNNDGLITIAETDKLLAFLSGGAYVV